MITFLGDVHTHIEQIEVPYPESTVIQVGDLGLGLRAGLNEYTNLKQFGVDYFIRGNHDNPEMCRNHPAYLGDYGFDTKLGIFFMSGAQSIDKAIRTEGIDWWPDEQLSYAMASEALECYIESKPRIVVTHDCPLSIAQKMGFKSLIGQHNPNVTNQVLDAMLEHHAPEYWIFGHWHQSRARMFGHTAFICVGISETYPVDWTVKAPPPPAAHQLREQPLLNNPEVLSIALGTIAFVPWFLES